MQCFKEEWAVVLPCSLHAHAVDEEPFLEFKNQLSGLNTDNVVAVQAKLVEMGLSLGRAAEV